MDCVTAIATGEKISFPLPPPPSSHYRLYINGTVGTVPSPPSSSGDVEIMFFLTWACQRQRVHVHEPVSSILGTESEWRGNRLIKKYTPALPPSRSAIAGQSLCRFYFPIKLLKTVSLLQRETRPHAHLEQIAGMTVHQGGRYGVGMSVASPRWIHATPWG